ncbi:MAG: hypothetical protein M3203_04260, partial [Actinomycetota bacterium]|nr:hypothetical protein [Actinomycetota bacterium]
MDERAEPPGRSDRAPGEADRLEALEQQVRQLTSRLAGWVEAQLVQALEDRRSDMKALRSELQVVVDQQLAGIRAESGSILSVATRRLEVAQDQLSERLDAVAERVAEASKAAHALTPSSSVEVERVEILEQQLDALRTELQAALAQTPLRGLRTAPADNGLEQRVRSAISRLSESVEAKLVETTTARHGELDALRAELQKALAQHSTELRTDLTTASTAFRARVAQVQERLDGLEEQHREAEARVARTVEEKLAEVVDRRRAELDEMKWEMQEALAKQLSEARADIGTSVSDAHRRFLDSVERLDERMNALGDRAAALASSVEVLNDAVGSNGQRIEALELHTRRTDERLNELVDAKLGELVERRGAELEEALAQQVRDARTDIGKVVADAHRRFLDSVERLEERMTTVTEEAKAATAAVADADLRMGALEEHTRRTDARLTDLVDAKLSEVATERIAELDEFRAQLRNALDAHLAETRADVASAVGEGRHELAVGAARLDRREAALAEAEERLVEAVEAKLADIDGVAERMVAARELMAGAVASVEETAARAEDRLREGLSALRAEVDAIAAATARAAFAEEGALAPVRSDVRRLQAEVAELART